MSYDDPPEPTAEDEHAYVLADVEPTAVVPCLGALGFWRPPASVIEALGLGATNV